jgi:hypothetical protein
MSRQGVPFLPSWVSQTVEELHDAVASLGQPAEGMMHKVGRFCWLVDHKQHSQDGDYESDLFLVHANPSPLVRRAEIVIIDNLSSFYQKHALKPFRPLSR